MSRIIFVRRGSRIGIVKDFAFGDVPGDMVTEIDWCTYSVMSYWRKISKGMYSMQQKSHNPMKSYEVTIMVVLDDGLHLVPAGGHMVDGTSVFNAERPGHEEKIAE